MIPVLPGKPENCPFALGSGWTVMQPSESVPIQRWSDVPKGRAEAELGQGGPAPLRAPLSKLHLTKLLPATLRALTQAEET